MKLEKDDKLGQGRGAFNPATRVQIPMGANQILGYIQLTLFAPNVKQHKGSLNCQVTSLQTIGALAHVRNEVLNVIANTSRALGMHMSKGIRKYL